MQGDPWVCQNQLSRLLSTKMVSPRQWQLVHRMPSYCIESVMPFRSSGNTVHNTSVHVYCNL